MHFRVNTFPQRSMALWRIDIPRDPGTANGAPPHLMPERGRH
jgi:hypothetical protein